MEKSDLPGWKELVHRRPCWPPPSPHKHQYIKGKCELSRHTGSQRARSATLSMKRRGVNLYNVIVKRRVAYPLWSRACLKQLHFRGREWTKFRGSWEVRRREARAKQGEWESHCDLEPERKVGLGLPIVLTGHPSALAILSLPRSLTISTRAIAGFRNLVLGVPVTSIANWMYWQITCKIAYLGRHPGSIHYLTYWPETEENPCPGFLVNDRTRIQSLWCISPPIH
jgi:hypothetical protein